MGHAALVLRADASADMGTGHVMRCLALAHGWQDAGGRVFLATAMEEPALEARLRAERVEVVRLPSPPGGADDAARTAAVARGAGASWVVVDGYHLGAAYQCLLKDAGCRLLLVDDTGSADRCPADAVLNQNIYAHEGLYAGRRPFTRLLLGTRYAILRREFAKWRGWERAFPDVGRRVLVTLGGSDPDGVTLRVLRALQRLDVPGLEAKVVVGPANPHRNALRGAAGASPGGFQLLEAVTDMPALMAWADVAVSAGGTTCWELAFMGLPSLVVVLASNQEETASKLHARGVAVNQGWHELVDEAALVAALGTLVHDEARRRQMGARGRELVDGLGVERVLAVLAGHSQET